MGNIYPIQPFGEPEESREILSYGERDTIGLEDPAASLSDFKGWNEARAYTRRIADPGMLLEHSAWGLHKTLKAPRGLCWLKWDGTVNANAYKVKARSYLQDVNGQTILRGTSAFTTSRIALGQVEVTMLTTLGTTTIAIPQWSRGYVDKTNPGAAWVAITQLQAITSATKITVRRIVLRTASAATEEGDMIFAIHCN